MSGTRPRSTGGNAAEVRNVPMGHLRECQKAHWKQHKPDCLPPINVAALQAELHGVRILVEKDLQYLVSTRHIPGLFEGTYTPTIHVDLTFHPNQTDPFRRLQLNSSREVSRADLSEWVRKHGLEDTTFPATWDRHHQRTKEIQAGMERYDRTTPASLVSHSATIKWVWTVIADEGSPTQRLTTAVDDWNDMPLYHFSESALDPRNWAIDWGAALKQYFKDRRNGTAPIMQNRVQIASAVSRYYIACDEGWGERGDGRSWPTIAALDTFLSDPGLHYLASQRKRAMAPSGAVSVSSPSRPTASASAAASAIVSTSTPLHTDEPTPTDLLLATPPAILKLLTLTSPVIQALTTLVQLLTWTHPSFFSSLLVLLGWWTLCLFGRLIFLYGLNALVLAYVAFQYVSSASQRHNNGKTGAHHRLRAGRPATLTPASYTALVHSSQLLATHVHTLRVTLIHPIAAHLSFVPLHPSTPAPAYATAWLAFTSYPFYLAWAYFVPLNLTLLVAGSVAILWNAPFFRTLRTAMGRSAFVRWTGRIILSLLRGGKGFRKEWRRTSEGVGIPGLLGRKRRDGTIEEKPVKATANEGEGEDVQLQFTVFENQRWWVGLDWTHALLPGERASWTDPTLNPSSPPASFTLPSPSITYTPSPTRSDPTSRIKHTTEWKWLDPEWKVQRTSTSPLPLDSLLFHLDSPSPLK
ncbi:hypothetical protein RQP46_001357 [Phenoliferia psychrophenolica]